MILYNIKNIIIYNISYIMSSKNTFKLSKTMKNYNKNIKYTNNIICNKHKYDFTRKQCKIWLNNTEYNPIIVDDVSKLTCKHLNWITLNEKDTINNYKFRHLIDCEKCNNKSLRFCLVHDDDGDYICFRCGESVSIRYRCFNWNCKHSINEDKAIKELDVLLD